jgi:putative ABC transport system permease protein
MFTAFSLISVMAGFVICYSRLGAVFRARTWEIGLLRAVGLSRRMVFWELLKEGLQLGFAGSAVGVALGSLIAEAVLPVLSKATAISLRLPEFSSQVRAKPAALLVGIAVGVLASVGAAFLPALRLAFTEPVAALTMKGRERTLAVARVSVAPLFLIALAVAALVAAQWLSGFTAQLLDHGLLALAACVAAPSLRGGTHVIRIFWGIRGHGSACSHQLNTSTPVVPHSCR